MRATLSIRFALVAALSTVALGTFGCEPSEPVGTAEGSGAAVVADGSGQAAIAEAAATTAVEVPPATTEGSAAPSNFVTDGSGNAVECKLEPAPVGDGLVCPEGCVMIKGAPVDAASSCARVGIRWEVAMGCIAPPVGVQPGGACYVNPDGFHVLTAITYPAILTQGWSLCPESYPYRTAAPCPPEALPQIVDGSGEGSAAGVAAP